MNDLEAQILQALEADAKSSLKTKRLAKRLGIEDDEYPAFRKTVKKLLKSGRIATNDRKSLKTDQSRLTTLGLFRRTTTGNAFVRPKVTAGEPHPAEIRIRPGHELDAATGDEVLVRLTRKKTRFGGALGDVVEIVERATRTFVGEYLERDGEALVRVDGTVFAHSISVGDPGSKGAKPKDKVVIEMLRFPSVDDRGEGVVVEVLGRRDQPGVDVLTIVRGLGLPEDFPPDVIAEARAVVDGFHESNLNGRTDFTDETVITIDPVDARDFDDAVGLTIDPESGHWLLDIHIADVGHFAPAGSKLDVEARNRATSIYLPRRVIPMFPELISNGVASLQEGRRRYVKTVRIEYTPALQIANVEFFNAVIRVTKRYSYEQVQEIFNNNAFENEPVSHLLRRMRDLAKRLRAKRLQRGTLELEMPEAKLDFDNAGRVIGAFFAAHNESHHVIEEFMLAANESVAVHFADHGIPFLRRVHPSPNIEKLKEFAEFANILGYPLRHHEDRFELQSVLRNSADKPERAALHYALLRSLKQASYSPIQDQHYALAMTHYCHFTSPIRRYPDLTVHRQLDRWIQRKKAQGEEYELLLLGDHCSRRERRAELAERELVKIKVLEYLSSRIGEPFAAVVTGVAEYGFFAQCECFPAEGLVHISSLTDDLYRFDELHRSLIGGRTKRRFRLGDRVTVTVARVDPVKRLLDFRVVNEESQSPGKTVRRKRIVKKAKTTKRKKK